MAAGPLREFLEKRVPVRRPGTPQEVARLVGALFADDIPFLTGETIYIDGGQGMAH
jgi:NAD(P)-dependent dehydrogenase (short-subunit alcohol dehydrogenase family)